MRIKWAFHLILLCPYFPPFGPACRTVVGVGLRLRLPGHRHHGRCVHRDARPQAPLPSKRRSVHAEDRRMWSGMAPREHWCREACPGGGGRRRRSPGARTAHPDGPRAGRRDRPYLPPTHTFKRTGTTAHSPPLNIHPLHPLNGHPIPPPPVGDPRASPSWPPLEPQLHTEVRPELRVPQDPRDTREGGGRGVTGGMGALGSAEAGRVFRRKAPGLPRTVAAPKRSRAESAVGREGSAAGEVCVGGGG